VKRELIVSLVVLAAITAGIAMTVFLVDLHNDRQYTVRVTGKVPVYESDRPPAASPDEGVIQTLHASDQVRVLRIVSHDEFQAIKVRLPDGREGYIFCCQNFELRK
jgi:hypothetical protein